MSKQDSQISRSFICFSSESWEKALRISIKSRVSALLQLVSHPAPSLVHHQPNNHHPPLKANLVFRKCSGWHHQGLFLSRWWDFFKCWWQSLLSAVDPLVILQSLPILAHFATYFTNSFHLITNILPLKNTRKASHNDIIYLLVCRILRVGSRHLECWVRGIWNMKKIFHMKERCLKGEEKMLTCCWLLENCQL